MSNAVVQIYNYTGKQSPDFRFYTLRNNSATLGPIYSVGLADATNASVQALVDISTADSLFLEINLAPASQDGFRLNVPLKRQTSPQQVFFVNNPDIDYFDLVDSGADITRYLFSSGYDTDGAALINGIYYEPAANYDFGNAPVVALAQITDLRGLTQVADVWNPTAPVNKTVPDDDSSDDDDTSDDDTSDDGTGTKKKVPEKPEPAQGDTNYVTIIVVILAILAIIVIVIVVAVVIAKKQKSQEALLSTEETVTSPAMEMLGGMLSF